MALDRVVYLALELRVARCKARVLRFDVETRTRGQEGIKLKTYIGTLWSRQTWKHAAMSRLCRRPSFVIRPSRNLPWSISLLHSHACRAQPHKSAALKGRPPFSKFSTSSPESRGLHCEHLFNGCAFSSTSMFWDQILMSRIPGVICIHQKIGLNH